MLMSLKFTKNVTFKRFVNIKIQEIFSPQLKICQKMYKRFRIKMLKNMKLTVMPTVDGELGTVT